MQLCKAYFSKMSALPIDFDYALRYNLDKLVYIRKPDKPLALLGELTMFLPMIDEGSWVEITPDNLEYYKEFHHKLVQLSPNYKPTVAI